jgi:integrase
MSKRVKGTGHLIPPRPGITNFWYARAFVDGKQRGTSTKVVGKLQSDGTWTGKPAAEIFLRNWITDLTRGTEPVNTSKLHYADLRSFLITKYRDQENSALRTSAEGVEYIDSLVHLDKFFGFEKPDDKGTKVAHITLARIDAFKAERKTAGAANGTINRALAALRRMFTLAKTNGTLSSIPFIEMLPEPKQPRQGFLSVSDYEKLYAEFGREVKNEATGETNTPFAYIQPILQTGFYTGMRLDEILNLQWSNVDLAENMIILRPDQTKNEDGREIPMLDGLPGTFENLRRAAPDADENAFVFCGAHGRERVGSFRKAWTNACIKCAIRTKLNGIEVVSHISKGPECCAYCKAASRPEFPIEAGKYVGLVFHDLRRTFVSNMVRAGVGQLEAMAVSGHKTPAVFKRYNIESRESKRNVAAKVGAYLAKAARESGT